MCRFAFYTKFKVLTSKDKTAQVFLKTLGRKRRGLLSCVSVFCGGHAGKLFKQTAEIVYIQNTAMLRDGLDLQIGGFEQVFCMMDTAGVYVGGEGLPTFFFKQSRKVAGADVIALCHGVEA